MSEPAIATAQVTPNAGEAASVATPPAAEPTKEAAAEKKPEAQTTNNQTTKTEEQPQEKTTVVPEKYDLKLPEGSLLQATHVERRASQFKELGLTQAQAQALLESDHQDYSTFVEANKPGGAEWTKRIDAWESEALADKDIGGTKEQLAANAELGKRVINRYFPPEIQEILRESGYGSHPAVLKGFAKLGKAMSEDQLVIPGSQAGGNKKSMEDIFYGGKDKQ